MNKKIKVIILSLTFLVICMIIFKAFNSDTTDKKFSPEIITPAQNMNYFVEALKKGDSKSIYSLLSKNYLKACEESKIYKNLQCQEISNIRIKFDVDKFNNSNVANYVLIFDLLKVNNSPLNMSHIGEYQFSIRLISENDVWKIDEIKTI